MAAGDFTKFQATAEDLGNGVHNLSSDTLKVALLTNATVPTAADTTPQLADYTQVTAGGNYSAGGYTLTQTFVRSGATTTLDSDDPTWAQDAGNPTNARYGLLYNDSAAGKQALGFIDLGSEIDLTGTDLTLPVDPAGWLDVA